MIYRTGDYSFSLDETRAIPTLGRLSGLAAPAEKWQTIKNKKEKIQRGAFGPVVEMVANKQRQVPVLFDHDPDKIIDAGESLKLFEGEDGLRYQFDIPDNPLGRQLKQLASNKMLRGVSIGFSRAGKHAKHTKKLDPVGDSVRLNYPRQSGTLDGSDLIYGRDEVTDQQWEVLTNIDLKEVSFVTPRKIPEYRGTTIEQRARDVAKEITDFLKVLYV